MFTLFYLRGNETVATWPERLPQSRAVRLANNLNGILRDARSSTFHDRRKRATDTLDQLGLVGAVDAVYIQ